MVDTAAERLAASLYPSGLTPTKSAVEAAQRAIANGWVHRANGWVHRDDLIAEGWTPPPDPWEAIARRLFTFGVFQDLLAAVRDLIPDEAEARAIAARIEEGT